MTGLIQNPFGTEGWLTVVLGATLVATFLFAVLILSVRAEGKQRRTLAALMGRSHKQAEGDAASWVPAGFAEAGERLAQASGMTARLEAQLEQAGLPMKAGEFAALTVGCALIGAVLGGILVTNVIFMLLVAAATSVLPYLWVRRARGKRQKRMGEQLADVLGILASSLRAGHSFLQALDQVANEIKDPSASEFHRVVSEIRLGRNVDQAMVDMAERVDSDDLRWAIMAVNIQRQVGGNLAEVLDTVANTVRERAYVHRQVRVLSAEGRISIAILSVLPFALFAYLWITNPEYATLLFTTRMGLIMLLAGATLMSLGIFVMTRIVKIDV